MTLTTRPDLSIKGESIQSIYNNYINVKYLVNRRYQRKLIWTLEEKQSFIESILKKYPIPLILLAESNSTPNNGKCFEIIDGMQRLNAIFSFIEQEFAINGKYFDLDTMADTKKLKDSGELTQLTPILDRKQCADIANYQIPLSIYQDTRPEDVDDIFRRLNSGGKHLSKQELRQAGVTSEFATLVRDLACSIRGDHSNDILDLNNMKKISLNNKNLKYGIDIDNIFWVSNSIINKEDLRQSKDEEIIADLVAWILLSGTPSNSDMLDGFYEDKDNKLLQEIRKNEDIKDNFTYVYEQILDIIKRSGKTFNKLIFRNKKPSKISRYFQIIFIAFYKLLITENKRISNMDKLIEKLDNIAKNQPLSAGGGNWSKDEKTRVSDGIYGVIFECFTENDQIRDRGFIKLQDILSELVTEQVLCDFKLGFHSLHPSNSSEFNKDCLSKIIKTLTAMANSKVNSTGYCIIGVADNKEDGEKHKNIYGNYLEYNNFIITGIDGEVKKYHDNNYDNYQDKITKLIEQEKISDRDKSYILRNIDPIKYFDKRVILLSLKSGDAPSYYDGKYFERHGSNVKEIAVENHRELFSRFKNKS